MVLVITEIYSYDDDIDGSCDQTDVKVLSYMTFIISIDTMCCLGYQSSYCKDVRWMVQCGCCHGYTT